MATETAVSRDRRGHSESTVLVVDDEADIRELLELTLLRMGLDVRSAGSVEEATRYLRTENFALCLTDMRLPDGEGLELVRYIASACADVPVAVITAHGSTEIGRASCRERGWVARGAVAVRERR